MSILRYQVSIPRDTNVPEDVSTNTWHFQTASSPATNAEMDAIATGLRTFYEAIDGELGAVCNNPVTVKCYDLADAKPRPPKRTWSWTLVFGTTSLPEEVAIVLSFQAQPVAGTPTRRLRNRVYIGPLRAIGSITNGRYVIDATQRSTITTAAQALLVGLGVGNIWVIHSPSLGTPSWRPVVYGWVDDAFDTQRRRGPAATTRTTFGAL